MLSSTEISNSLDAADRQYLVGELSRSQSLAHIESSQIEVGISDYDEPTADVPHTHPAITECQYMIAGRALLLDLRNRAEIPLNKGDFYLIEPDTPHVQKSLAGTTIFFFKYPANGEKITVEVDEIVRAWLGDFDF